MSHHHATLCKALGDDLRQLAALHDRELDRERIATLRADGFPESLGLLPQGQAGRDATQILLDALGGLDDPPSDKELDDLAADYADLYLNHGLQTSPLESVWLDEEGLTHQGPMFEVRDYYQRHGLGSAAWRVRSDDHLCLQLEFLAFLFEQAADATNPQVLFIEAANFLDEHLLRWIPEFGLRTAHRCATPFYAGLGLLTAGYVEELRQLLEEALGQARPTADEIEERMHPAAEAIPVAAPTAYVPGVAPSW
jgi:TorA maturation chaperone TorD